MTRAGLLHFLNGLSCLLGLHRTDVQYKCYDTSVVKRCSCGKYGRYVDEGQADG